MAYLPRVIDQQLDALLPHVGAIAIEGAKAVGKTETASRRVRTTLRLDNEADRALLNSDPSFEHFENGAILLDEWQKQPESWDMVRRAVDRDTTRGRFLLTGSATPVVGTDTHSGAGRILSLRMRPMAIFERGEADPSVSMRALFNGEADIRGTTDWTRDDYVNAIASSGFPDLSHEPQLIINNQLDSYLQRIVDRDLVDQGYTIRNREGLTAWLRAYAAASSTTTNFSEILDAATAGVANKPAKSTTQQYREKLSEIWMLDEVPAWDYRRSPFAGLAKAPKHQLADPAFVLRLLAIPAAKLATPRFAHMLGPLFESLATLSVRVAAQASFGTVSHFRTSKGNHEVDLIAQNQDGDLVAFEVKVAHDAKDDDVRHLLWLKERLGDDLVDMVVLTTGNRAYRRTDGVAVVPLALLGT